MTYQIEISSVAKAEADKAFQWLCQVAPIETARNWYQELLKTIESLSEMPRRCPLARENNYFSKEIRQLLYGRGRNSYRIIFTIVESQEVSIVRILHIRHVAQQTIGESQDETDSGKG
ncbi:MAG: type II toxin-antitoxin system RelE/ParE family toxin [Okeania sp. SIO2F4]|uniref:type II toxin-antitoxin system RelE/ParE family toxin n=1 Tax=Okeania sp. SIO2F4 TaxID=2607790 RepID=UPI001429BB30|nr:type II toxin-antitoxin system RelE/ParE family toxin [Okeania sp. SIO2F4]NES04769.1 type II toxin-antitoxin system RelE/ParE family toxin [Okeania sp. SIO2F4]